MPLAISYIIVLHIGIVLPIVLTILANIYLIVSVRKLKHTSIENSTRENLASLQKLTNRLVVWAIFCNVPYIVWYHLGLDLFMRTGKGWVGVQGVCSSKSLISQWTLCNIPIGCFILNEVFSNHMHKYFICIFTDSLYRHCSCSCSAQFLCQPLGLCNYYSGYQKCLSTSIQVPRENFEL